MAEITPSNEARTVFFFFFFLHRSGISGFFEMIKGQHHIKRRLVTQLVTSWIGFRRPVNNTGSSKDDPNIAAAVVDRFHVVLFSALEQTHCTLAATLRAPLSGTFLQTLPDLVMPLKGHSLSPRSCPPTRSAPSERFGY